MAEDQLAAKFVNIKPENSELMWVPIERVFPDYVRNVRDEVTAYDPKELDNSIVLTKLQTEGFHIYEPLLVHREKPIADRPFEWYDLLDGNRRYAMSLIAGITSVYCQVLSGLDAEAKIYTINTSAGRKNSEAPIDRFKQIRNCASLGMGKLAIARHLGLKSAKGKYQDSQVQRYMELIGLPQFVIEEWHLAQREPESNKIKFKTDWDSITTMHANCQKDRANGDYSVNGGPEFRAFMDKHIAHGLAPKKKKEDTDVIEKSSLRVLASGVKVQEVADTLLALSGKPGLDVAKSINKLTDSVGHHSALKAAMEGVTEPHLQLLVFGPKGVTGTVYDSVIASTMKKVVEACQAGFILHPDNDMILKANVPGIVAPSVETVNIPVPVSTDTVKEGEVDYLLVI